ncbi:MAG: ATP-dependent Clp protease proteolytic subunit [Ignisphaera sp.]|nr:ATP-dependent Clp protease proteolytic subunit [Ignisphaera sp.]MCX8168527.1 ATP-dependent Clp protease proteolytic subunit [Ignisphaera sp.]MDW8085034.1 NfeD family protein [Ignisphaera sp.]
MKVEMVLYGLFRINLFFAIIVVTILLTLSAGPSVNGGDSNPKAIIMRIEGVMGAIDSPTEEYVRQALTVAESRKAPLLVVINSYGGYIDPTINIANMILEARTPVIGFIMDRAFSAASILIQPMHIVASVPYGVIGAAQPISVNPVTGQYQLINESKIINSVVAMAVRYAEIRGRNTTAVEMFIRKNLVLSGYEAVANNVVDLIANNINELISVVNGRSITLTHGGVKVNTTIQIYGVEEFAPPYYLQAYAYLRDSTVNSILWFIGFFGTFLALLSGRLDILPFTFVFLLLALIGGGMNINVISVILLALGAILVTIEMITPGYGIIGVSGIVALTFGFLLMPINPATFIHPGVFETLRNFVLIIGGGLSAFLLFIMYKAVEAERRRKAVVYAPGSRQIIGRATERIEPGKRGLVFVEGEYWYAESEEVIEPGEEVIVLGRKDFTLIVKKKK